jgi:hypothetical protein
MRSDDMYNEYLDYAGQPFDDSKARYIDDEHKYMIEINYVKKKLGQKAFGSMGNTEIKIMLDEIKDQIYSHIKSESRRENYDVIEYRIAKKNWRGQYQAREDIIAAMLAQVKYAIRSGGDMLGDQHGVNLKKGTAIQDFHEMRRKLEVSSRVDRILRDGDEALIMQQELSYSVNPLDYRVGY